MIPFQPTRFRRSFFWYGMEKTLKTTSHECLPRNSFGTTFEGLLKKMGMRIYRITFALDGLVVSKPKTTAPGLVKPANYQRLTSQNAIAKWTILAKNWEFDKKLLRDSWFIPNVFRNNGIHDSMKKHIKKDWGDKYLWAGSWCNFRLV